MGRAGAVFHRRYSAAAIYDWAGTGFAAAFGARAYMVCGFVDGFTGAGPVVHR